MRGEIVELTQQDSVRKHPQNRATGEAAAAGLGLGHRGREAMGRDVDAGLAGFACSLSRSARLATSPWTVLTFLPISAVALSSSDWRRPVTKT